NGETRRLAGCRSLWPIRQAGASAGHEAVRCSAGEPLWPPGGSHMIRRFLLLTVMALLMARAAPAGAQPAAGAALLRLDDLPAGWSVTDSDAPAENGAVGDECGGGEPIVPASHALAQFAAGPDGPFLLQSVAVFVPG